MAGVFLFFEASICGFVDENIDNLPSSVTYRLQIDRDLLVPFQGEVFRIRHGSKNEGAGGDAAADARAHAAAHVRSGLNNVFIFSKLRQARSRLYRRR